MEKTTHDLCFDIQKWFQGSLPASSFKKKKKVISENSAILKINSYVT